MTELFIVGEPSVVTELFIVGEPLVVTELVIVVDLIYCSGSYLL